MTASLFRRLVFAAVLSAAPCRAAEAITVRVIDVGNRQPVPKQQVVVSLYYSGENRARDEREFSLTTDASGAARFTLPEPAPQHIAVQVVSNHRKWECVCMANFSPQTALATGIVETPLAKDPPKIQAKPGEIIFGVRKTPFWLRPLYPLYKD